MLVPQNQAELYAGVPAFGRLLVPIFIALFQIEGRKVDVISKWEEEHSPNIRSTSPSPNRINKCQVMIPHTMDARRTQI